MGMSSAVRVSIRVRPFNRRELNANAELAVQVIRVLKISIFLNIFFAKFQNQKQSMGQVLLRFITVRRRPLAMTSVSGPTQNRMLISPIRVKFSRQSALSWSRTRWTATTVAWWRTGRLAPERATRWWARRRTRDWFPKLRRIFLNVSRRRQETRVWRVKSKSRTWRFTVRKFAICWGNQINRLGWENTLPWDPMLR